PVEGPVVVFPQFDGSASPGTDSAVISTSEYEPTLTGQSADDLDPENPYMGLRAFQEADAGRFFGREDLIAHLLDRLAGFDGQRQQDQASTDTEESKPPSRTGPQGRFLAVIGPSGSGKSSVVKAGVIPAIRRGDLPGSANWFVAEMTPGNSPI